MEARGHSEDAPSWFLHRSTILLFPSSIKRRHERGRPIRAAEVDDVSQDRRVSRPQKAQGGRAAPHGAHSAGHERDHWVLHGGVAWHGALALYVGRCACSCRGSAPPASSSAPPPPPPPPPSATPCYALRVALQEPTVTTKPQRGTADAVSPSNGRLGEPERERERARGS
jgi:hypothetical protein